MHGLQVNVSFRTAHGLTLWSHNPHLTAEPNKLRASNNEPNNRDTTIPTSTT